MGSGGAGKIILDCRSSLNNFESCISVNLTEASFNLRSGDFSSKSSTNEYYISQQMLMESRTFVFNGAILNTSPCMKGEGGVFCQKCKGGTYKSSFDNLECTECPCLFPDTSGIGLTSIDQCKCRSVYTYELTFPQIVSILLSFAVVTMLTYMIMQRNKKYIEKNYMNEYRYKVKDIPDTEVRLVVCGQNTPQSPLAINKIRDELIPIINQQNFELFCHVS